MRSSAQQAPAPTPGVIRINVNLVQVDAVVTDSAGRPVTNLGPQDFELLQDGKPQKITNFEFIRVRDTLRPFDPSVLPMPRNGTPPPPDALKRDQIRRTVALVVDDLGLSGDSIVRIRESLKKWVEHEMQPGDLVAVVRTNAGVGSLQQFTNDKRMLNSAIDMIRYQPGRVGIAGISPLSAENPINTNLFEDELEHAYLRVSFASIQYVIRGLRDLPGRKSLVLFSESMRLTFLDGPGIVGTSGTTNVTREDNLRKLADEANRSSVVIYSIDPRGPTFTGLTASDGAGGRTSEQLAEVVGQRTQQFIQSQDGLVILAQKTGGLFYVGNDIASSIRKAVDDGNGYYLMGYQPEGATFDERNTSRFHSISVRVKRPGLMVRSRTGFFGTPDNRAVPVPRTREAQIAKALVSPFTTGDLDVRLTTLFSHSDAEGSYVKSLLHFDARDLTFTEEPDGSRSAVIDVAIVTFDADGKVSANVDKTWRLNYPKAAYEEVLRRGLVYSTPVPIKKAGPYQLRVALRDANSEKLGSATQFIEVPDVASGRLVVSGIVMTAASQPAAGGTDSSGDGRADIDGTPAVRIFKAGSAISYAYEILNVRTEGNDKSQLESQVRLFRDGLPIYSSPQSAINTAGQQNAKRLAVGGRLELTKIPPGNYVMQVVVSDTRRKDKNGVMAQAMDFQVRE
jgi:VWFA-related protein